MVKRILSSTIWIGGTAVLALALMQPALAFGGGCCGSGGCAQGCTAYGEGGTNYLLCLCNAVPHEWCRPVE
ncbi:MAG: hypothetical protein ACRD04_09310 [Terriglobales bacterium]